MTGTDKTNLAQLPKSCKMEPNRLSPAADPPDHAPEVVLHSHFVGSCRCRRAVDPGRGAGTQPCFLISEVG